MNRLMRLLIIFFWLGLIAFIAYYKDLHLFRKKEKRFINVFTWEGTFPQDVIEEFEEKTGIKVYLSYYSSNEEMFAKLRKIKRAEYDLLTPTDYTVKQLIDRNLIQKIDWSKVNFEKQIIPFLKGLDFDPGNVYSIPFEWEVYGFGIDREYFQNHPFMRSWKQVFDPSIIDYKIAMINDPIEAIYFASNYLYGPKDELNQNEKAGVLSLLKEQKPHVVAYAALRGDYLLATKNCRLVVSSSSWIFRSIADFPFMRFIIPREGSFISLENFAIPLGSKKQDMIYEFLNYIYQPEVFSRLDDADFLFPATKNVQPYLNSSPAYLETLNKVLKSDRPYWYFIKPLLPEKEIIDLWVDVKS